MRFSDEEILKALKDHFGYSHFRLEQEGIIKSVLSGKDTLGVMPTGGGKSICFQLSALLLGKVTLVISPLIALMKDQVDGLKANGISAAFINSTMDEAEQQVVFQRIKNHDIKLLYIAPESLSIIDTFLTTKNIALVAIDEAHCISSWGHDFRPAYTQLGVLKEQLPDVPFLALTATADRATREDILTQLKLDNPEVFVSSFNRSNLYLEVRPGQERLKQIKEFITKRPTESGIIYCLSRKSTEDIAKKLKKEGFSVAAYHAGLKAEDRTKIQDQFIRDDTQIICATIAFGMGIDKSNVRWVIHYNLPKNIEGYYQEIGRAGRDGLPSDTLLFYSYADIVQLRKFAKNSSNTDFQISKLERMQQFAESLNCRRKALLSYFGELMQDDCGNCDNCKSPPELFDGTVIAQKALSAVARLKESENITNLVDFIRGSSNTYIYSQGYQNLKTYGVGKEQSWKDWNLYIIQLLNQGICEIAFHEGNRIKLTELSNAVLYQGKKVILAKNIERAQKIERIKKTILPADDSLFQKLRTLRTTLAKEEGVPPYLIFSDATLKDMSGKKPTTAAQFMDVSGVGKAKLNKYGEIFIQEIIAYGVPIKTDSKGDKPQKKRKESTFQKTLKMYQAGRRIEEIAAERELGVSTILGHFIRLKEEGHAIDLVDFISDEDLAKIEVAKNNLQEADTLRPYYEYLDEKIDYGTIKLGLAILKEK